MSLQGDIQTLNKTTELQKKAVTDNYNAQIKKAKEQYEEQADYNVVQKYINERQLAERMDNLGLTDSGLNRTQQTAVQLSYANNAAKIQRQKQSAVDAFILEMNNKLTDLETSRLQSEQSIRDSYEQAAASARSSGSGVSSGSKSSTSGNTTKKWLTLIDANDKSNIYTFVNDDGKKIQKTKGVNPYTNTDNSNNQNLNKYGFWNGYQPKGFIYVDASGKTQDTGKLTDSGQTSYITGKGQHVWRDKQGNLWVWDDYSNQYIGVG